MNLKRILSPKLLKNSRIIVKRVKRRRRQQQQQKYKFKKHTESPKAKVTGENKAKTTIKLMSIDGTLWNDDEKDFVLNNFERSQRNDDDDDSSDDEYFGFFTRDLSLTDDIERELFIPFLSSMVVL